MDPRALAIALAANRQMREALEGQPTAPALGPMGPDTYKETAQPATMTDADWLALYRKTNTQMAEEINRWMSRCQDAWRERDQALAEVERLKKEGSRP